MWVSIKQWFNTGKKDWWLVGGVWLLDALLGAFIVFYYYTAGFDFLHVLEGWSYVAQLVIAVSALFAAITFFYQRDKDKINFAIEQVSFYRKEVRPLDNKLWELFEDSKLYYEVVPICIKDFTLAGYERDFPEKVEEQRMAMLVRTTNKSHKLYKEIFDTEGELLNALEQFSLGVIYTGVTNYKAMGTVKQAFVETVERHAYKILLMAQDEKFLQETSNLYNAWKNQIVRNTITRNIPGEKNVEPIVSS